MAKLVQDTEASTPQAVNPLTGVPLPAKRSGLDFPAGDPWFYGYHPARWMYYPGANRVLPCLVQFTLGRGINNTTDPSDSDAAVLTARKQGYVELHPEKVGAYSKRIEVRNGAAYLPVWCEPISGGKGAVKRDESGFLSFLAKLVDKKLVEDLPEHIRAKGLARAKKDLHAAEKHAGPAATTRETEAIERAKAAVAAWERGSKAPAKAAAKKSDS